MGRLCPVPVREGYSREPECETRGHVVVHGWLLFGLGAHERKRRRETIQRDIEIKWEPLLVELAAEYFDNMATLETCVRCLDACMRQL